MDSLRRTIFNPRAHGDTLLWFVVTCFGALFPLIAGIVITRFFNEWHGWGIFWKHGEFYLYSAAFCTHAAYELYSNKRSTVDFQSIVFWIAIIALVLSGILYAAVAASIALPVGVVSVDATLLSETSFGVLGVAMMIDYISRYIETVKKYTSVEEEDKRGVEKIKENIHA